jgi:hypothetical protein
MDLVDCREHRGRPPHGAVYIGRAMGKLEASPLANPYAPKSAAKSKWVVPVPDDQVLEYFKRRFLQRIVESVYTQGTGPEFEALQLLGPGSKLACWCTSRPAIPLGPGAPQVAVPCHGDVIFTVWRALVRLGWDVPFVIRGLRYPFQIFERSRAALYEECFGEPIRWGTRGGER